MKVISISTDITVFKRDSETRARMEAYGRLFDELHIIVYTSGAPGLVGRIQRFIAGKYGDETPSGFKQETLGSGAVIYPTNSRLYVMRPLDAFWLGKRIIKEHRIDVISVQDPAESGIAGWLLKKTHGVKLHIQIHADFFSPFFRKNSWKELVRYWLARFIIPRGDKFRVVSRRVADSLRSAFSIRHSAVYRLPIFVDRERIAGAKPSFDLCQKYPEFDFIIIMVSRLVREKNIPLALSAFRDFLKEFPQAGLVIVGDGPERKNLEFRIQNLELSQNVRLEGWQNDLVSYYKGAALCLLTSNSEGYGRSGIEAAAAGCSVVMTDVGVAGEAIQDGETGRVVKVGDKNALTVALSEVRCHHDDSRRMAERVKELILASPPRTWQDYLKLYKDAFDF